MIKFRDDDDFPSNAMNTKFIEPPKEMLEKAMQKKKGVQKHVDKKLDEMNDEERAVFDCLEDSDNNDDAYDMLEDDFILLANEGQVAIVKETGGEDDFENNDILVVGKDDKDEYGEEDPMMLEENELKEYRQKMYEAVLKQQAVSKSAVAPAELQADLDANFDAFLEQEYNDD